MAEIVNLRRARKAQAREQADNQAKANRFKFGRTKVDRKQAEGEAARAARDLVGKKLDR